MIELAQRELNWWEYYPLHKLWCNDACPLVPRFKYSPGDEFNANNWSLHWLIFHIWTLESFSFSVDAAIEPHDGIYIGICFIYMRIIIGIRHTWYQWQGKLGNMLRRKPALKNEKGEYN